MGIVIITVVFALVCFVLRRFVKKDNWDETPAWLMALCATAVVLIAINVLVLLVCRTSSKNDVIEFQSTKETVKQQRLLPKSEYERVQLTKEIIEANRSLASNQYWAKSFWTNWYVNKGVLDLTPIE